jgi:hypothetical protein
LNAGDGKAGKLAKATGPVNLSTNDKRTIVETPAACKPPILARLEAQGSTEYRHRPGSHDIVTVCPLCGEKLIISDSEKWLQCFGPLSCGAHRAGFDSILIRVR